MPADPNCPHCQGTGWKQVDKNGLEAVVRCECLSARAADPSDAEARAGIPERFRHADFSTFTPVRFNENPIANKSQENAMIQARTFAEEYPLADKRGLLLQGPPGTGKTHLAVAALKTLMGHGYAGRFFAYSTLLQQIRASYDSSAGASDRTAYRSALDAEILLLDDLGAHRATDWVFDTVQTIINHRYNENKAILVTTNLPLSSIGDPTKRKNAESGRYDLFDPLEDRIGQRAVSRLMEMCRLVRIDSEDYRLKEFRGGRLGRRS